MMEQREWSNKAVLQKEGCGIKIRKYSPQNNSGSEQVRRQRKETVYAPKFDLGRGFEDGAY
jgi:hypothetical protein